jgi:hypothetical protein
MKKKRNERGREADVHFGISLSHEIRKCRKKILVLEGGERKKGGENSKKLIDIVVKNFGAEA